MSTFTLDVISFNPETARRSSDLGDPPMEIVLAPGRSAFGRSERHARGWQFDYFVETYWDVGFKRLGLMLEARDNRLRLLPEGFPVVVVNGNQVQGTDGRPFSLPAGVEREPWVEVPLSSGDVISIAQTKLRVR